jgi:hypothetical protein
MTRTVQLCVTIAVFASAALAQDALKSPQQPASSINNKLVSAKTAYLIAGTPRGPRENTNVVAPEDLVGKPIAQQQLTKAVQKWHRLDIVDDPNKADLVLLVVEWEDYHRWGHTIACRDQLFVFAGGGLPSTKSQPLWLGDPERWGKWGGCSGAGEPIKELRKAIENADKASR